MPEPRRLDDMVVQVDGTALPVELYGRLTLVQVEESVQLPDTFALHFDDPHFELFDEDRFRLGTRVQIAFRAESDPVVVTSGEVTAISVEPGGRGRHELVVTGLDLTHRLARGPKSRTFVRMSDADIAGKVAREYGLDIDIEGTDGTREYVLQAGETDYAFLKRLAGRIGFDVWVTERTFHFKRRPAARAQPPTLVWGGNLHRFKVRFASAEHCDEVVVRAWNPVDKRTVSGRSTDADSGSDAPAVREMADSARSRYGRVTRTAVRFPATSQAEADALARSLLAKASGGAVVLRGEAAGDPWLAAGAEIRLDRVGRRLAGKYRLTSVTHVYGVDKPYTTRFECGGKDAADLADLVGTAPGGPAGGLMVGIVTNTTDPDKLGRVKVRFPALSDGDESTWARVASPGAGPRRGMQWLPEVDDEVFVGFELDDHTRPVVLGGLWNRTDQPPEPDATRDGRTQVRVLASRRNHRLVLTDDPTGAAELAVDGTAAVLHLEEAESKLAGDRKLVVTADEVEIRATGALKLHGQQVEISADATLKLTGQMIELN